MKDPKLKLREEYYTKLGGASGLSYTLGAGATTVIAYDGPPNTFDQPYIVLGEQTSVDITEKTSFMTNNTIEVQVVTSFDGNFGGKKDADTIADGIIQLIRTRTVGYLDLSPDFKMITSTLDSDISPEQETSNTKKIYRRLLTFRHIIQEL